MYFRQHLKQIKMHLYFSVVLNQQSVASSSFTIHYNGIHTIKVTMSEHVYHQYQKSEDNLRLYIRYLRFNSVKFIESFFCFRFIQLIVYFNVLNVRKDLKSFEHSGFISKFIMQNIQNNAMCVKRYEFIYFLNFIFISFYSSRFNHFDINVK